MKKKEIKTTNSIDHIDVIIDDIQRQIDFKQDFVAFILIVLGIEFIGSFSDDKSFRDFGQSEFKADTDVFPKIRIAQVKKIPIKFIPEKEQIPFVNLVDKIISLKQQGKDSSEQEKKIDNLVYKLFELSYDEVKVIEPAFSLSKKEYDAIKF